MSLTSAAGAGETLLSPIQPGEKFSNPIQRADDTLLNPIQRASAQAPLLCLKWLASILAPFGVADAQACVGLHTLSHDACKGANLLQRAAQQHHAFAEVFMMGYYDDTGKRDSDEARLEKALLWHLHFMTHFPDDKDISREIVGMLKLTPEQERAAREKFKTWNPQKEPPVEPASCPGTVYEF